MDQPAQRWSIRRIQATFQATSGRHYYWAADRQIPAENNLTGRDLHLTVMLVGWDSAYGPMPMPIPA